ncbi:MAG TPA: hypothetical protein VFA42_01100 [Gaiellaceae bacterium]|nr:hypothetical protein [Gaiellaceae bacterium]
MRPLFGPRTVVEAAFLVAVPIVALEVGLGWPVITGAGGIAYLIVLAVEAAIWREGKREAHDPTASEPAAPEPSPEPALVPVPSPEPEHVPAPTPPPEPELLPPAAVTPISPAPAARRWNVSDLERLAREHAGGDPILDEERTFLLMYLRDFAGPDGLLPADFDDLVRKSFGGIVARP